MDIQTIINHSYNTMGSRGGKDRSIMAFRTLILITVLTVMSSNILLANARGKISGKIFDSETTEPLIGVNVLIDGTEIGTTTDLMGDYFLANIPVGTYSITVSMIGYRNKNIQGIRVSNNNTTRLDFDLVPVVLEGEEIIVTAQRPLIDEDNTSTVMYVKSEELENRTTTELTDVLSTLPSVNVDNGEMTIRGGTLDEVSLMVDGTRIRNPLDHSSYTYLNLSAVEELQVITGGFNAEYGEARSGIINVISKSGSDEFSISLDARYIPPGKRHWGVSLYDTETELYWENAHARHLEWWVEYPDMWVDNNGAPGNDPECEWTPEEAFENYLETHQPLSDYLNLPSYQLELSLGGPIGLINNLYFFSTLKYRSQAPLFGNSYLDKGEFMTGTLKLKYLLSSATTLTFSGFWGRENTAWGIEGPPDYFYALDYGITSRYAYFDWYGLPESSTSGQTVNITHMFDQNTMLELKLSRMNAKRKQWEFPDDPIGWEAVTATYDNLRAFTTEWDSINSQYITSQVVGGNRNAIGYHTIGYYYRFDDNNTEWVFSGSLGSQRNKYWYLKTGFEFTYYNLDHFNQAKFPDRRDDQIYKPYQMAVYAQNKLELGGFIMNAGLRWDGYNANDTVYSDVFDPIGSGTEKTKLFSQLSPRLGISHPISDKSVLHFSYGHFFQRASFGEYGEGNEDATGSLTTFIIDGSEIPWVLGNRELRPLKTVAYEVGIERSFFDIFALTLTGFYKDIRNTVKSTFVETPYGSYTTTGNGNYADYRGVEISLQKYPQMKRLGSFSGYFNYTTQIGIDGKSGDPTVIRWDGVKTYETSGDYIVHSNPRIKAGVFYTTPGKLPSIANLLNNITVSLEYQSVLPNENLLGDAFYFEGKKYLRKPDQNLNCRIRKGINLPGNGYISAFVEIHNVLNQKWINFDAIDRASIEDRRKFVESDYEDIPEYDLNGTPLFETAKYRNLPRSILFGFTIEL